MSHYFKNDENLIDQYQDFDVKIKNIGIKLRTNSGVFSRSKLDLGTKIQIGRASCRERV